MTNDGQYADIALALRIGLIVLVFVGLVGVALALAYERHWQGIAQWIPWATIALVLVALVLLVAFPSAVTKRLAVLVAILTIVFSLAGIGLHFYTNFLETGDDPQHAERWETMGVPAKAWEVAKGSVGEAPLYAPGVLIFVAIALATSTNGLGREEKTQEYVDPRRR